MILRLATVTAVLCVPFGAPATLAAQEALPARLSAATRDTLVRLIDSARVLRLPTDPLAARAAEGVLKGADDARIVRAVRSLVRELADARDALPPSASPATLAAGASALHAGVSPRALRRLASAGDGVDEADLAVALIALADLVASRVPPEAAASSIELLLKRRAPEAEITAFRAAVTRDILAGRPPEAALSVRARAIARP
jgi:hypothetical protein